LEKISCRSCLNSACIIKKNLIEKWDDFIEKEKVQAIYKKDYSVFGAGNPINGLFFVQNGLIQEYMLNPRNEVEIVRFAGDGEVFGHAGFENSFYTFGADAKIDSVICFILNDSLKNMYELNQNLLYDLMLYYSNEHSETTYRLLTISQMNLREKIASVLSYLYEKFGLNEEKEILECITREDIASLACTTFEQVSRQLSDFQREKLIEKHSRRIAILNPDKIKDIIREYKINISYQ
jgi:CRP/FNR family transcriptional regulator, anaerobic regulatory protein